MGQADRVDLVDAAGARVVADLGRVAGDGEDVPDPSAWAPSRTDSSPITVVSRGVRCGIVSIPTVRSIAAETISGFIPTRAVALSLTST